jgi:hypothetical protein
VVTVSASVGLRMDQPSSVPQFITHSFCRHCHQEIGDFHAAVCPLKVKQGVDYRDVVTYKYRLYSKLK